MFRQPLPAILLNQLIRQGCVVDPLAVDDNINVIAQTGAALTRLFLAQLGIEKDCLVNPAVFALAIRFERHIILERQVRDELLVLCVCFVVVYDLPKSFNVVHLYPPFVVLHFAIDATRG